jgi:hypothetical protein
MLGTWLGIQPTERRVTWLLIAHSFAMGLATVLFETAASATFLTRFEATDLPWVYMASAVLNAATGVMYARAQATARFGALMKGTLWGLLGLVLFIRSGQALTDGPWFAFAAMVAYRIISGLTDLEFWAVAGRIYDIGQARRLFGVVGTGEVVARTAGAFCVPLVIAVAGVSNLMVISAAALLTCIFLVGRILESDTHAVPSRAPDRLRRVFANPYMTIVIAVAVLATFGKFFVDFAFLEQVGRLGKDERQLATVLAIFSGVAQAVSLFLRVFVSRPLLARVGIRIGVLILPGAQLACTLALVGSGLLGASGALFGFVLLNQGIYKALKHPIDNAAFKVLYQPLSPSERFSAQLAVEVLCTPVVVAVAGGVMLAFARHFDPTRFAFVLLAVFATWFITAQVAGRKYAQQLDMALHSNRTPVIAGGDERRRIRDELLDEANRIVSLQRANHVDANAIADARRRMLERLASGYPRLASHLAHGSKEKRALARELLDVEFRGDDRIIVAVLVDES